jgi:type 1 glutamine amidotransferase
MADPTLDRRDVMKGMAMAAGLSALGPIAGDAIAGRAQRKGWEWEPMRWIQICAADDDPGRYDKQFWLDFLRRTKTQGVCLSAGGVTAYYPTKVPFHARSPYLGSGDMFGELAHACKAMGIRVLGRVDPHAGHADMLAAHPDWIAHNADGSPKRHPTDPELYLTCPNGPVTFEWMPQILTEIVKTYPVDGIFGNRWAGSAGICHCPVCTREFKAASDFAIPDAITNPRDPQVRAYMLWDDEKRYAQLKLWGDTITRIRPEAFFTPGTWGRLDPKRLRQTIRSIYADRQGRSGQNAAWLNGRSAKEAYCLMQDRPVSGIFAVGETSTPYRLMDSTQSNAEIAAYLHDGLAHGFRPWMTKFKAEVFDKRWVPTIEKAYSWHAANEGYFRNTVNLARVALLQSAQTNTYYAPNVARDTGAAGPMDLSAIHAGSEDASNGFYRAMVESRIAFNIVDERQLDQEFVEPYKVIALANAAALSDAQCQQLRAFVMKGGSLVATHESSLYDEWGKRRDNFALADLFGCDFAGHVDERVQNSYMTVHGPGPLTAGFDDTPRIIAGTKLVHVTPRPGLGQAALTLVPSYPDLPMERVFPRQRTTDVPMVYARTVGKGRVVYFPFDLDRTFWEVASIDHLALLRNAVLWAANEPQPMAVSGPGLLDTSYWQQQNSVAAHLVNLTNPMAMKGFMREILPAGPYEVRLRLPSGARPKRVRLLEAAADAQSHMDGDTIVVQVPRVVIHEVVAVDFA